MRILGIDPGLAIIGYGCIEGDNRNCKSVVGYGCITTSNKCSFDDRLCEIAEDFEKLLHSFKPDMVVMEELFFNKNVKTALQIAHVRGLLVYLVSKNKFALSHVNPLKIKESLTGNGKADKKSVQKIVKMELKMSVIPSPDDAADALAGALTYFYNFAFK